MVDTPRVGIDIVAVERVRGHVARHGERWLKDMFSARELTCLGSRVQDLAAVAARVAAKEAVIKVLAPGDLVPWRDIEVLNNRDRAPAIHLSGRAAAFAARQGLLGIEISITHDRDLAAAVALGLNPCRCTYHDSYQQLEGSHGPSARVDP